MSAINDSRALTLNKLNQLITDLSLLLQELCESKVSDDQLVIRCEQFLDNSKFKPDSLIKEYLVAFAETESW